MPVETESKTNLRYAILKASKDMLEQGAKDIESSLEGYYDDKLKNEGGSKMDTMKALDLQYKVGNYNNLATAAAGMEKAMKESIAASARSTS